MPPFNTAIVNGYNAVFSEKKKLGSWPDYLEMRETILKVNEELRPTLSKDLGAFSGLLFDVGVGKLVLDSNWENALKFAKEKVQRALKKRHDDVQSEISEENEHLRMQLLLTEIGRELGYNVFVANNDRTKCLNGKSLDYLTIAKLPEMDFPQEVVKTISLIDVIWINRVTKQIDCAFEVEKSTSIYSGILRLLDLGTSLGDKEYDFFLVAPDSREKEIVAQLKRPSFKNLACVKFRYLLFSDLKEHSNGICKFGENYEILFKIAKALNDLPLP